MKRVLASALMVLSSSVSAGALDDLIVVPALDNAVRGEGLHGEVLAAVVVLPKYSGSQTSSATALPLINVSYNDSLYFNVHRLGYWLPWKFENDTVRFGLLAEQQRGFVASDGALLAGMSDREAATEAGINVAWDSPIGYLDFAYLNDVSDTHDGTAVKAMFSTPLIERGKLLIKASGGYERMSRSAVNYYYGVKLNEVTATRPLYAASDSTIHTFFALDARYRLSKQWSLNAHLSNNKLGEQIENSPIVDKTNVTVAYIAAGWHF
jgi:outer membrane scaffolding protein for murein synthesis (MipA/OmpV family)